MRMSKKISIEISQLETILGTINFHKHLRHNYEQ